MQVKMYTYVMYVHSYTEKDREKNSEYRNNQNQ